jgi:hypothetical protein
MNQRIERRNLKTTPNSFISKKCDTTLVKMLIITKIHSTNLKNIFPLRSLIGRHEYCYGTPFSSLHLYIIVFDLVVIIFFKMAKKLEITCPKC